MEFCVTACIVALAIWFGLSVANQFPLKTLRGWQRADVLQLLPMWNFFAPRPGVHDYYLLYRNVSESGSVGDWQVLQPTRSRGWSTCVWNPDKIENKVVSDLVQMFADYHKPGATGTPATMLTLPYLVWLQMTVVAPAVNNEKLRQFVLAQKQGLSAADHYFPIIVSDVHSCE